MTSYCGKGLLYFYNLIFLGIAGVLMYMSVLYVRKWGDYSTLVGGTYSIVPAGLIFVFGIIVFITGIVGLFGICNENRCTLSVFFALLLIILSVEIVGGILTFQRSGEIELKMKDNLWSAFNKYDDTRISSRRSFDIMQGQLRCCGVTSQDNWVNASRTIPESCCIHPSETECYKMSINLYKDSCYDSLIKAFYRNLRYIVGVLLGFGILQLIGLILAASMIILLKKRGYTRMPNVNKYQKFNV